MYKLTPPTVLDIIPHPLSNHYYSLTKNAFLFITKTHTHANTYNNTKIEYLLQSKNEIKKTIYIFKIELVSRSRLDKVIRLVTSSTLNIITAVNITL